MSDLATTNLILSAIAVATLTQSFLLIAIVWRTRAHVAALRAQVEALDLPHLARRTQSALDDLHAIAATASRAGLAVERTADGVHAVVNLAGDEVRRATMGVRAAFDMVAGWGRRAAAARAGLVAGVSELVRGSRAVEERRTKEAVAVMVSEGGHDA